MCRRTMLTIAVHVQYSIIQLFNGKSITAKYIRELDNIAIPSIAKGWEWELQKSCDLIILALGKVV